MNIESGGRIEFPPGSLPEGATITIGPTRTPILPDGVVPIGEAFSIDAPGSITEAVFVYLPIPPGVDDLSTLAIISVRPDGTTTFLLTSVEGDELVAGIPGLSALTEKASTSRQLVSSAASESEDTPQDRQLTTFAVGGMIDLDRSITGLRISGKPDLCPGEMAGYSVIAAPDRGLPFEEMPAAQDAEWKVKGPCFLRESRDLDASLQANGVRSEQWCDLRVQFINSLTGWRYSGVRPVRVRSEDHEECTGDFRVNLVARRSVVAAGDHFASFKAFSYGGTPPIKWEWKYRKKPASEKGLARVEYGKGGPVTTESAEFALPVMDYPVPPETEIHTVEVVAKDNKNQEAKAERSFRVVPPVLEAYIEGPTRIEWAGPEVKAAYSAYARGGVSGAYSYDWEVAPTGRLSNRGGEVVEVTFEQPGSYVVTLEVQDRGNGAERTAKLPVVIKGRDPEASFVDPPSPRERMAKAFQYSASSSRDADAIVDREVEVGEKVFVDVRALFGILVVSGKKGGYEVKVDWGDGTVTGRIPIEAESSDTGGTTGDLEHEYKEARTYQVLATVYDAASNTDSVVEWIKVVEKNTPPEAEDQTVIAVKDTPKQITLRGRDAEGDELTYEIVDGPAYGQLGGTAPRVVYSPDPGRTGWDSFTYIVKDEKSQSAKATVRIHVKLAGEASVVWELIKTEIIPNGSPAFFSFPSSTFPWEVAAQVSQDSIAVVRDQVHFDGRTLWTSEGKVNFTAPPKEIIPGEPFEISLDGTLEVKVLVEDYWGPGVDFIWTPPRGFHDVSIRSFGANSDGTFTTEHTGINVPKGFGLSARASFTNKIDRDDKTEVLEYCLGCRFTSVPDLYHRIEIRGSAPNGESGGHVMAVAWIYHSVAVP